MDTNTTQAAQTKRVGGAKALNSYQVTVFIQPWSTWGIFYAENRAEAERKARDYYCYFNERIEVLLVCGTEPSTEPAVSAVAPGAPSGALAESRGFGGEATAPKSKVKSKKEWQCMECGKLLSSKGASKAMSEGCPKCGGVDIDLAETL